MLDFDVSKMAVIGVVALVVLGPERLPRVSRTVGTMFGRAQRYFADVKAEVNQQIQLDEVKKLKSDIEGAVKNLGSATQTGIAQSVSALKTEVEQAGASIEQALTDDYLPSIHESGGSGWPTSFAPAAEPAPVIGQTSASAGVARRPLRTFPTTAAAPSVRRSVARGSYAGKAVRKGGSLVSSAARHAQSKTRVQTA